MESTERKLRERTHVQPEPTKVPHVAKSAAERQRQYRKRVKEDAALYGQHRAYETLRLAEYRHNRSDDRIEHDRVTARLRMQKYRQRKKEAGEVSASSCKRKTRATSETKRNQWKQEKQNQRAKLNQQQKRRINEKRRRNYALKKELKTNRPEISANSSVMSAYKTPSARKMAIARSLRVLPKSPEKFAEVVSNIIHRTTPRRHAALDRKCILSPTKKKKLSFLEQTSIQLVLTEIKKRRSLTDIRLRRILHRAVCAKKKMKKTEARQLGLSWNFLSKSDQDIDYRKKRADALDEDVRKKVIAFYNRGDITREMPNARQVTKKGPCKVLECSLQAAFQQFTQENPTVKISFSTFVKLRPTSVKTQERNRMLQCLCEYCVNVDFKIDALSTKCLQFGIILSNKYEASSMTLCPKLGQHYKKCCIDRECKDCGTSQLKRRLQPLLEGHGDKEAKWKVWRSETYTKTSKDKSGPVEAWQMVLKVKTGTVKELIDEFLLELDPYAKHLFNARWQAQQFEHLKSNIPEKWVLLCMDFGENYNCHYQDEAQSAHWSYKQATIHPVVAYYRCPDCGDPMHESLMFVSEDKKHDQHAVQHFVTLSNQYLLGKGIEIEHEIQFSDGSPTQYKSKVDFCDASYGTEDFGFSVEKHFFGSRHGKGPCDGEVGVLKKHALQGIKSRRVIIADAHDLFQYGKDNLTLPRGNEAHAHTRRTFFFVEDGKITRDRKDRTDVKPVPKSRSLHSFKGIQPYIVAVRERSCFCPTCTSASLEDGCPYVPFIGHWNVIAMKSSTVIVKQLAEIKKKLQDADEGCM